MINPFITERERKELLLTEPKWSEATALIMQEFLRVRWMDVENIELITVSVPGYPTLKNWRPWVRVRRI